MNRRNDRFNDDYPRRENNFDRMYDARQYRDSGNYRDNNYRDSGMRDDRNRDIRRDSYRRNEEYDDRVEEYDNEPKKRSFFSRNSTRKRDVENETVVPMRTNNFVVMTPKRFEDIQGIIDSLKAQSALIVDLCKLNGDSVQRVMDYINGAIYALDGSIQRINPAVFLLTPTGMGISVPIDYIKDKWERNKKR